MPANNTGIVVGWLAGRFPGKIGHLFSPGAQRGPYEFVPYAIDNGVFARGDDWEEDPFFKLLDWAKLSGQNPLWVIVPDVVGDRLRTLRKWELYAPRVAEYGWPLAFAVQDGMMAEDGSRWRGYDFCRWLDRMEMGHDGDVVQELLARACGKSKHLPSPLAMPRCGRGELRW